MPNNISETSSLEYFESIVNTVREPLIVLDKDLRVVSASRSFYEVWMLRDGKHMVSLGTFKVGPNGRSTVTLPVSVDPADYPIMDVSLEPDDGNPSHSSDSVLRSSPKRV